MDPVDADTPPWLHPPATPTTPCNNCYCKSCCYHCPFCFTKKGLGISYGRKRRARRNRRTTAESSENNQNPVSKSLPKTSRIQSSQKKQEKKVEEKTESGGGHCSTGSSHSCGWT
uniref:Protein Tat n=1 Tax=Simian immunodeficiency virus TaxID=11723 RepID=A0A1Z3GWQ3_SIV|nr:tat protein [Simian immunodeficiency virus]ASC62321.1 tat protein [Simian immunodeficiency virus]